MSNHLPDLGRLCLCGVAALLFPLGSARAQSTTTPPAAATTDEAITLSPFEVNSEGDIGYAASNTLAGTRLRTELKDIAASITVVTKEFLNDVGATNLEGLLVYTVGTETAGLGGNFSSPGSSGDFTDSFGVIRTPTGANRVRGLGGADQTRDYFLSSTPIDSYNIDRIEVNRGPNAMLFGLGSPAGIINAGLIKAQTNATKTKVDTQYGQHGTWRVAVDHNQVLVPERAAIRLAALRGTKKYQQDPAYIDDERYYLTATVRPWKGATIKASTEWAEQFSNKAQITAPFDNFSWWWRIGKPIYDPTTGIGSYLGTPPTDPNIMPFNANGSVNGNILSQWSNAPHLIMEDPGVTKFGVTGLDPSILGFEGSNNRVRLNAAGTALANDGMRRLQWSKNFYQRLNNAAHPEWFVFWKDQRITDPAIFPFYDQMMEGPNKREWSFWKTYTASFEQSLGANAGIEIAYDKQVLDAGYVNPYNFRDYAIRLDINTKLPNGVPNPNFLRPFIVNDSWQSSQSDDREAARATAYYDLRLDNGDGWLRKLLGRHVFTGSFTRQEQSRESFGGRPYFLGLDYYQSETANETRTLAATDGHRIINRQTYLGPSVVNAAGPADTGMRGITVNNGIDGYPNFTTLYYQTPAAAATTPAAWQARTFSLIQSDRYDFRRTANFTTNRTRTEVESTVLVANSYWWDGTLVSTVGWRRDAFKTFDAGAAAIDPTTGFRITDSQFYFPKPGLDDAEDAINHGFVAHISRPFRDHLPKGTALSLSYNKADNFQPNAQRYDMFNNQVAAPAGETTEYGVILSLFDNKVEARLTKYETRAALATNTAFRELTNQTVRRLDSQMEQNSLPEYRAVAPTAALSAWNTWQQSADAQSLFTTFDFKSQPGPNGTTIVDHDDRIDIVVNTSDTVATGYEYDLILNPTRSWRIALNAARQETVRSNTGKSFQRLIDILNPVWGGSAAALPNSATDPGTLGQQWAGIVANVQKEILLDGSASPELRKWRFNLVNTYSFTEGRLKGWRVGGSLRWQDKVAIGYPVIVLPGGAVQSDVLNPFFGPAETNVDLWVGYSRKLRDRIKWSVQLNVRNLGVGDELIPVSSQPDGTAASLRIAEPQTWLLTNTFEF